MRVYLDNCCYNRLFDDRSNIKNYLEREAVQLVYESMVSKSIKLLGDVVKRAKDLASQIGTKPYDSLHLALSEGNTDYFLTTDVKLIKASKRTNLDFRVMNPIEFIMEVANDE